MDEHSPDLMYDEDQFQDLIQHYISGYEFSSPSPSTLSSTCQSISSSSSDNSAITFESPSSILYNCLVQPSKQEQTQVIERKHSQRLLQLKRKKMRNQERLDKLNFFNNQWEECTQAIKNLLESLSLGGRKLQVKFKEFIETPIPPELCNRKYSNRHKKVSKFDNEKDRKITKRENDRLSKARARQRNKIIAQNETNKIEWLEEELPKLQKFLAFLKEKSKEK